jgi:hypothetical protein
MAENTPLFEFAYPLDDSDTLTSAADKLDQVTSELNLVRIAEWLVGIGVLTQADPEVLRRWRRVGLPPHLVDEMDEPTRPEGFDYVRLAESVAAHAQGAEPAMGEQVLAHLEAAVAAMKTAFGLRPFMEALARAQDAASAAMKAGYRQYPIPDLLDFTTGAIAFVVAMIRAEIMARILDGRIDAANAEAAWRTLDDPRWGRQAEENAMWFRAIAQGETRTG